MAWPRPGPGRPRGSVNKASLPWKRLARQIASDPDCQAALKAACLTDPHLMLKVVEHAHGKPRQSVHQTGVVKSTLVLDSDVSED